MTPERWERVKALFHSALECPPSERAAYLASACGQDQALREEIERLLLSHDQAGSFIESPALDLAGASGDGAPMTESLAPGSATPEAPSQRRDRAAPRTFSAGDLAAGRYRILRFVARGGMGEVYEAEDLALLGKVALKTIRPDIAEDARALDRFKREIHVARKVTHPNVCRIYDLGAHQPPSPEGGAASAEVLFLTMELLSGETLSERITRRGRLSTEEALPLVAQIVAGLDAAHAAGVVHRDFKSANVLLVPDAHTGTRAVITDFGLARALSADASLASLSDSGAVAGTPAYMAPEQVQGLPLTHAADLYALGIVLYEMLTGLRPFDGGSAISVAARRLTEAPRPPHDHVPGLDPLWESVVLRCLEREPRARFASAGEIVRALGGQVVTPSPGIAPSAVAVGAPALRAGATRERRRAFLWIGLAATLALSAGYWLWQGRTPRATATSSAGSGQARAVSARRSLAVLGLKNNSALSDAAWISTAISEMLTTDLAAGGGIRLVPRQEVSRVKRDLDLKDADSADLSVLARLHEALGADLVVLGSFTVLEGGLLRIDLRLIQAATGELVASGRASGTTQQLFDLVSRASGPLRDRLGIGGVSPEQALEVEASLPSSPEARRLYAEGLEKLRVSDARTARDLLERAVAAEPKHPLPHAALADAWSLLGYQAKAKEESTSAVSLSGNLPREAKLALEARAHVMNSDWEKAIDRFRTLLNSSPDNLEYGLWLADAQTAGGRAKETLVTVAALRKLPRPASEDARIDLAHALALQALGDFRQARDVAETAAGKSRERGLRLLVAHARLVEATASDSLGDAQRATAAAEEARGLFQAGGDRGGVARALIQTATTVHGQGDLDGARRLFERSLTILREIGDKRGTASVLDNLAMVLFEQGKAGEAEKLSEEALATFRQIGAKFDAAAALNLLGARFQGAGDLPGAQRRYQEALALFGEIGDRRSVAITLMNVAEVLFTRGDLGHARDMHEESLAICREIGDKDGAAYDLHRLGEVFSASGDLRAAQDKYEESLKLRRELGDKLAVEQTRLGLAALALAQGHATQAEAMAREAEEVLRTGGAADAAILAQAILAASLLAQGRTAEARRIGEEAEKLSANSQDRHIRWAAAVAAARVRAASTKPEDVAAALNSLESTRIQAAKSGFLGDRYDALLAQGEVELASGRSAAGRARLQALAKEADAKGFGSVARRAARALGADAS